MSLPASLKIAWSPSYSRGCLTLLPPFPAAGIPQVHHQWLVGAGAQVQAFLPATGAPRSLIYGPQSHYFLREILKANTIAVGSVFIASY